MTAPAAVPAFTLALSDRRRLLVDLEDGTYREVVGTVTAVYPTTVNVRCDDGKALCLYRRQILAASYPDEPIPADDPIRHCIKGRRYRFVHHADKSGWVTETVGLLHMAVPQMAFVDVGDVTLVPIARNLILFVREVPE